MSRADHPRPMAWVRTLVVVLSATVIQVSVLDRMDFGGILRIELPLLIVVAVAMRAHRDDAIVVGFAAGVAADLFQLGPFGQSGLAYCVSALLAARLCRSATDGVRTPAFGTHRRFEPGSWFAVAARRAFVAGTALVVAWLVVVVVTSPSILTRPVDLIGRLPLAGLTGAVVGIHPVVVLARRLRLVGGGTRAPGRRHAPLPIAGSAWPIVGLSELRSRE